METIRVADLYTYSLRFSVINRLNIGKINHKYPKVTDICKFIQVVVYNLSILKIDFKITMLQTWFEILEIRFVFIAKTFFFYYLQQYFLICIPRNPRVPWNLRAYLRQKVILKKLTTNIFTFWLFLNLFLSISCNLSGNW